MLSVGFLRGSKHPAQPPHIYYKFRYQTMSGLHILHLYFLKVIDELNNTIITK